MTWLLGGMVSYGFALLLIGLLLLNRQPAAVEAMRLAKPRRWREATGDRHDATCFEPGLRA